jgi:cytochrome c556
MVSLSDVGAAQKDKDKDKKDAKVKTISEIMEEAHMKGGILPSIGKELKAKKINWDAVESKTKDLLLVAGDLSKNDPPKGPKTSWEKHTKNYMSNVESLQKAIEKQDLDTATKSHAALTKACNACHTAHKE